MKMIVGLGNPGKEYVKTRHNAGWIAIDLFLEKYGFISQKNEHHAEVFFSNISGEKVLFVKPQTFMNKSGIAVRELMDYYKILKDDVIIFHDEKDFPITKNQFKAQSSASGHNGIKSIIQYLSGENFKCFRIGVGNPEPGWQIVDWVLSKFNEQELEAIKLSISKSLDFILEWHDDQDFKNIMTKYNFLYK